MNSIKIVPPYCMNDYDAAILSILNDLHLQKFTSIVERIVFVSNQFLGKPYLAGALGEGKEGQFDQNPLYRTDVFDCVTFVNTVLALALSENKETFRQNILAINYYNSEPRYEKRFHFTSADWNIQNAKKNLIEDVTIDIKDALRNSIYEIAETTIDRPSWFNSRSFDDIKLLKPVSDREAKRLLNQLRAFSSQMKAEKNQLPYLPLSVLFNNDKPNNEIFLQIPHGAIIEIVRPDWNLHDKIGTNLNVSHLGFALRIHNHLIFRQASLLEKRVIDVPLIHYLKDCRSNPTIKGIHILRCKDYL